MPVHKSTLRRLISQQCRLRHLRSFCARNLCLTPLQKSQAKLGFYFTLQADEETEAFYESEVVEDETNLNWKSFNWTQYSDNVNLSLSCVLINLWLKTGAEKDQVILSEAIDFKSLHYLGEQIPKDGHHFYPCTLVFEMFEGFYAKVGISSKPVSKTRLPELPFLETAVRNSYDWSTLKRVHTVQRAIKQTRASVLRVRNLIHERLAATQDLVKKRSERECVVSRLNLLRDELEHQKQSLQTIKAQCVEIKHQNQNKALDLVKNGLSLKRSEERLADERHNSVDARESLVKTMAQLHIRRRQLISELNFIYPIETVSDKTFTICGVALPNSEDFAGRDELMISVALGYVGHLVTMIAQFLNVPLRYPTVHMGTRSKIYDNFFSTIPDSEREFPLYAKGKDKLQFKYGVYLLNKNISQLRFYCGLTTQDLRLTLPNLKALLDSKLSVRIDPPTSASVNIEKAMPTSVTKQLTKLTEDPSHSGSTDSLQDRNALWKPSPEESCRSGTLSLSLDHGLDEIVSLVDDGHCRTTAMNINGHHLKNPLRRRLMSTELRSSEPSLAGNTYSAHKEQNNDSVSKLKPLTGAIHKTFVAPLIYASESEPEDAEKHCVVAAEVP